jgi:hypothetical protein
MFIRLDFLYMPSRDPAAEARYFCETLGARLVFAIEAFGTRVAMVEMTDEAPALLFAGHLDGERPILVYRVADLEAAIAELGEAGELTRPETPKRLEGRRDF